VELDIARFEYDRTFNLARRQLAIRRPSRYVSAAELGMSLVAPLPMAEKSQTLDVAGTHRSFMLRWCTSTTCHIRSEGRNVGHSYYLAFTAWCHIPSLFRHDLAHDPMSCPSDDTRSFTSGSNVLADNMIGLN